MFTQEQREWWRMFEDVREEGSYNMLDSRAREASGLKKDQYFYVMKNYSELKKEVLGEE